MANLKLQLAIILLTVFTLSSCKSKTSASTEVKPDELNLKRGDIISCGSIENEFGTVSFDMSCSEKVREDFNLAVEMLHSFEYDESEKMFAKVIDAEPNCAMAYWGVAMSNYHPLWAAPTEEELKKGAKAVEIAKSIPGKSERESAYIDAIGAYFADWDKKDHMARTNSYTQAMEAMHAKFPKDKEAAVLYALALDASAKPTDKTFTNQLRAGEILNALYPNEPDHPGVVHYIIHTYDYPGLAEKGLEAARKYARVAPASAHALHMPSHIFTRLGLWNECISSNLESSAAAKCYAEAAGLEGNWDEELHVLDYLVYAYLQKGKNDSAISQLQYLRGIKKVTPVNFKVAYSFAAIPSRIALENKNWNEAVSLTTPTANVEWEKFPWQKAIVHFAKGMGAIHTNNPEAAKKEIESMKQLRGELEKQKNTYSVKQVEVQIKTTEAWLEFKNGNTSKGIQLMQQAAAMEDSTEKHPVTPGEILPARELLADMLLAMNEPAQALATYEQAMKRAPNRLNSLYGAAKAAELSGNREKAGHYYKQLISITEGAGSSRKEIDEAKQFLSRI